MNTCMSIRVYEHRYMHDVYGRIHSEHILHALRLLGAVRDRPRRVDEQRLVRAGEQVYERLKL